MRRQMYHREEGFTLVELLCVIAIIGILLTLASHSYALYKSNAFNSSAQSIVHQTITAVEAGKIENDFMADWGFVWVYIDSPGPAPAGDAADLLPGLIVPSNFRLWVFHDAWCAMGLLGEWCTVDWVAATHCGGDLYITRSRLRNGMDLTWEDHDNSWAC